MSTLTTTTLNRKLGFAAVPNMCECMSQAVEHDVHLYNHRVETVTCGFAEPTRSS